jgi:hypothetical protein
VRHLIQGGRKWKKLPISNRRFYRSFRLALPFILVFEAGGNGSLKKLIHQSTGLVCQSKHPQFFLAVVQWTTIFGAD